jgi:hypothetical protein
MPLFWCKIADRNGKRGLKRACTWTSRKIENAASVLFCYTFSCLHSCWLGKFNSHNCRKDRSAMAPVGNPQSPSFSLYLHGGFPGTRMPSLAPDKENDKRKDDNIEKSTFNLCHFNGNIKKCNKKLLFNASVHFNIFVS